MPRKPAKAKVPPTIEAGSMLHIDHFQASLGLSADDTAGRQRIEQFASQVAAAARERAIGDAISAVEKQFDGTAMNVDERFGIEQSIKLLRSLLPPSEAAR